MSRFLVTASAIALTAALASNPVEAVQRAFVASYGSDANTATNCGFANPCRGFTAAMTVVDPGGEVVALDAAGYGAATITKSITLTANPGFHAGVSASSGHAITIATAGVEVVLRGLNLNGIGASRGINMTAGASLAVENCVISNFFDAGINVDAPAKLRVADSVVRGNGTGILVSGGATADVVNIRAVTNDGTAILVLGTVDGTTTTASVSDSIASGNVFGMFAQANGTGGNARLAVTRSTASNNSDSGVVAYVSGAVVTIGDSMLTGNGIGLNNIASATIESLGNNIVRQNTANVTGQVTTVPGI